jgi:hypothetical protein
LGQPCTIFVAACALAHHVGWPEQQQAQWAANATRLAGAHHLFDNLARRRRSVGAPRLRLWTCLEAFPTAFSVQNSVLVGHVTAD